MILIYFTSVHFPQISAEYSTFEMWWQRDFHSVNALVNVSRNCVYWVRIKQEVGTITLLNPCLKELVFFDAKMSYATLARYIL